MEDHLGNRAPKKKKDEQNRVRATALSEHKGEVPSKCEGGLYFISRYLGSLAG